MDIDSRSTHLGEEKEEANVEDLKAEEAAVGMVEEAADDESKEIEVKVKIGLT